ncbi:MAG TPA: hypothetical protein VID74_08825 [Gemmatimonadales bacterium]
MPAFELAVILAEADGQPDCQAAVASIERACAGLSAELLVVRPQGGPQLPSSSSLAVRELATDNTTLVPERWGIGVRAATAPVFACLTTEFTVHDSWARSLLTALATDAVGAAGAIELAPGAGTTAAAIYLVRFSAYLPRSGTEPHPVRSIPGDTAAYRRDAVVACADLLAEGFWEIEFHRRFAAAGRQLLAIPAALSTFRPNRSFNATVLLRYRHGYEYGVTRVVRHRHRAWRLIVTAPVVPLVLVARILRRVVAARGYAARAIRAFPALAAISLAWAVGEAAGAWSARGRK